MQHLILPGCLAAGMWMAPALNAETVLDFAADLEGFSSLDAAGTTVRSTSIGAGSVRLTNPATWLWRGKRAFTKTGTEAAKYHAFANELASAGVNGGTLRFDLILRKNTAITGKTSSFWGVQYSISINQTPPSGSGWVQKTLLELPAGAFPPAKNVTTYPVSLPLRPWSESTGELRVHPGSPWFEIQFGSNFGGATTAEWHIDNLRVVPDTAPPTGGIQLEAEAGTLTGVTASSAVAGYSGTGYATGFDAAGDKVAWTFNSPGGPYRLAIRYRAPFGNKGFNGLLNGEGLSGTFPGSAAFATYDAGLVELAAGTNTLELGGAWNYYEIDAVTLTPEAPALPMPVPAIPCDPLATSAARVLLAKVTANYGSHTLSGQNGTADISRILTVSGKLPAIIEGDFINYSPSRIEHGENPGNHTESILAKHTADHLVKFAWHWNAPSGLINTTGKEWWRGFYTDATTFDVAAALADPSGTEYALLLRDIDAIAVQLKKAADANIPILWRPLHESEGGWFWWGAKGPGPFKELWRLLYQRLTIHHGLHNLIWVLTSEHPDWYPGHDVVDVVGVDAYPDDRSDSLSSRWEPLLERFDGIKPLALTEFGGVPEIERMHRLGVTWAWFSSWNGTLGPASEPDEKVARIYQSAEVVTLDELPPANRAPVFAANPLLKPDAAAATAYIGHTLAADAGDPDAGDTLSFAKTTGPSWLVVAPDGTLSGKPAIPDAGTNEFTVRVTDGGGLSAEATLRINVILTHHQSWLLAEFGADADNPLLTGDTANPDHDGFNNLMEYALGTDPTLSTPSPITCDLAGEPQSLRLTIPRNPLATDVTFTVEVTGDLADPASWNTLETRILPSPPELLVVQDTGPGPSRFIRLKIVRRDD
jgi:mannan endo-1,4-beta-mannosidase